MSAPGSTITEPTHEPGAASAETSPGAEAGILARLWQQNFAGPLRRVEQEARAYAASEASRRVDTKVCVVLVTAAVCLTLQRYGCVSGALDRVVRPLALLGLESFAAPFQTLLEQSTKSPIGSLAEWCFSCLLTYFMIPALVVRLLLKESLRDYGVRLKGACAGFWIYALTLAVTLPLVVLASADTHFQETYPFYPVAPGEPWWPNLWLWELLYALQFFALEFFFRGFMVHGTRHRFGVYSVLVMTVPYCMIHFGKPMPEAFASIVAGIVLGLMSLKTRSIWMGAVVHVTVALSMDLTSLWRKGCFP